VPWNPPAAPDPNICSTEAAIEAPGRLRFLSVAVEIHAESPVFTSIAWYQKKKSSAA
jgi:hypothetical protein